MSVPGKLSKERTASKLQPRATATSLARANLSPTSLKSSPARSKSTTSPSRRAFGSAFGACSPKPQASFTENIKYRHPGTVKTPEARGENIKAQKIASSVSSAVESNIVVNTENLSRPQTPKQTREHFPRELSPGRKSLKEYAENQRSSTEENTTSIMGTLPVSEKRTVQISEEPDTTEEVKSPREAKREEMFLSDDSITEEMTEIVKVETINRHEEPKTQSCTSSRTEKLGLFHQMKKELDLKQEKLLDLHASLKESETGSGEAGEDQTSELTLLNVWGWSSDELTQLRKDAAASSTPQNDNTYLMKLRFRLCEATACMADVCQQALTNRDLLVDWIMETMVAGQEEPNGAQLLKLKKFKTEGESLAEMLDEMKNKAEADVEVALELSKRVYTDRGALEAVGDTLLRDVAALNAQVEDLQEQLAAALEQAPGPTPKSIERIEELSQELADERATSETLREKLASTETQLRTAKARINKMDRQLKETDCSLSCLTTTVKNVEDQNRQREVQLDSKVRKARDALKSSEFTIGDLKLKRDAMEHRITELSEQIATMTERHAATLAALRGEIASLGERLEVQTREIEQENELRSLAEQALTSASANIHELRAKVSDLEHKLPNPDVPTEREIGAWAEAQATQEALRRAEDELVATRRDKMHFLESLANITESGTEMSMTQKLASELLAKEEAVTKMQREMRDLTKNCKLNEHKVEQYSLHLKDLQLYHVAVAAATVTIDIDPDSSRQCDPIDLQEELMNMRMSLVELVHQNEDLMEQLRLKEAALEQQERTARAQTKVIKVREELINMLQNKETEQNEELITLQNDLEERVKIVDDANDQIAAKAKEIQELFSSVENKQQEIHRREKIIRALEEQLRRAQAQRTRQEEKIAALEHELVESGARRRPQDKKFLFF